MSVDAQVPFGGWFAARLLIESSIGDERSENPLIEERIVRFKAYSEDEAKVAAERYGRSEEHQYSNEAGETVSWFLRSIEDLSPVENDESESGWEVLSRFVRASELTRIEEPDD
jgi:hypothetical protein